MKTITGLTVLLLSLSNAVFAQGTFIISNGSVVLDNGGELVTSLDWEGDGRFVAAHGIVTLMHDGDLRLNGPSELALQHLTIDVPAEHRVNLGMDVTVTGRVVFESGDLYLGDHRLVLKEAGQLNERPGHTVTARLGRVEAAGSLATRTPTDVGRLGATIASEQDVELIRIHRGHAVQTGGENRGIQRYYDFEAGTFDVRALTLVYDESEIGAIQENTLSLFQSLDGGRTWEPMGGRVNTKNNTVTVNSIKMQDSRWTFGSFDDPLPVELTAFEVLLDGSDALLTWATASETNNAGFEVQHRAAPGLSATVHQTPVRARYASSLDGSASQDDMVALRGPVRTRYASSPDGSASQDDMVALRGPVRTRYASSLDGPASQDDIVSLPQSWHTLAFIPGHGTTDHPQSYTYTATNLPPGTHHFRLKQIDFDGTFAYSHETVVVVGSEEGYHLTQPYPNPANPSARFELVVDRQQVVEVGVYDILGRHVLLLHQGPLAAGEVYSFSVDATTVPSGLYLVRAKGKDFAAVRRLTILR